jgi:hypothetical protein
VLCPGTAILDHATASAPVWDVTSSAVSTAGRVPRSRQCRCLGDSRSLPSSSPIKGLASSSTASGSLTGSAKGLLRCGCSSREVLAGDPIRGILQALPAVAPVAQRQHGNRRRRRAVWSMPMQHVIMLAGKWRSSKRGALSQSPNSERELGRDWTAPFHALQHSDRAAGGLTTASRPRRTRRVRSCANRARRVAERLHRWSNAVAQSRVQLAGQGHNGARPEVTPRRRVPGRARRPRPRRPHPRTTTSRSRAAHARRSGGRCRRPIESVGSRLQAQDLLLNQRKSLLDPPSQLNNHRTGG